MAPPKYAEFVRQHFNGTSIKIRVEEGIEHLTNEYPLLAAVNRAANNVDEHKVSVFVGSKQFDHQTFFRRALFGLNMKIKRRPPRTWNSRRLCSSARV